MNMRTDIVYGYGIYVENLKIPERNKFVTFLKENINTSSYHIKDIVEYIESLDDDDDYSEWFWDLDRESICGGGRGLIADIMTKRTGITFTFEHGNVQEDWTLMIPAQLPWQLNYGNKNMTQENVDDIFNDYFMRLGIDCDLCDVVEYVRTEYYG